MKKTSIILLSVMALVACSKTEVSYNNPSEIMLAPVSSMSTKAAVMNTTYPKLDFYVFANAGLPEATLPANGNLNGYTDIYIKNAQFTNPSEYGVYTGVNCYWPNVKKLVFAGVSASGNVATLNSDPAKVAMNFADNKLTVDGYVQPDSGNNDLMWFPMTAAFGKTESSINVTMKHACSLLKFNFLAESTATAGWKVKSVVVNGLKKTGKAVCGAESVEWTPSGDASTFSVYSDATGTPIAVDDNADSDEEYITPETIANNTVVIPQTPTTASITYTFTSQAGSLIEETAVVPLSIGKDADGVEKKWESGKCYNYTITIGATEIKIAPSATTWGDPVNTPGTI